MADEVCASIIVYNEARLLPVALGCLDDDMPVHVTDGAYAEYPHTRAWSDDGTIGFAQRWGAEVLEVREAWRDQCAKRTAAMHAAARIAPVVFVLDADEIAEGPVPDLPEGYDVGWVWIRSTLYPDPYPEPRLYRWRDGWRFDRRHHWIYDERGQLVCSHRKAGRTYRHIQLPLVLHNMRDWRTTAAKEAKRAYRQARNRHELRHGAE